MVIPDLDRKLVGTQIRIAKGTNRGSAVIREVMKLAAKQIPALDALIKQRDRLLSKRDSLRTELHSALAANAETLQQCGDRLPFVPNGTHLAFMPQRYTDNLQRYVNLGGKMKPTEDISGFIRYNPTYALDQARFFMFGSDR
jgi:hypothetical protein